MTTKNEIKTYQLDRNYLFVHKEALSNSNFGMDNTNELIDGGFGLYSSNQVKGKIGPLKSEFFRIAICLRGTVDVDCGLETFHHQTNTIHFNFPNQPFSLYNKSDDMFAYYMLFNEAFIEDLLPLRNLQQQFPFLDYEGVPFLQLDDDEALEIENLFLKINQEIKEKRTNYKKIIQLYINLVLISSLRSYQRQGLAQKIDPKREGTLLARFKKIVAQHFITKRKVEDYATLLAVTPNHLNKHIKEQTGKTASSFIDNMLVMEAKALLRYTELSISEIAYQLDFTDPSHFNKFFKKEVELTPMVYRNGV
jgi:AraC family transcriptional regulator, transcriptional activator of pobA